MREQPDTVTSSAPSMSRRASLLAVGGGGVVAAMAWPASLQAGKIGKKVKKRFKKKCKRQVDQCQRELRAFCNGDLTCEEFFLPCCSALSDCKAGTSLDCFFMAVNR
jgi:hypothetical protein